VALATPAQVRAGTGRLSAAAATVGGAAHAAAPSGGGRPVRWLRARGGLRCARADLLAGGQPARDCHRGRPAGTGASLPALRIAAIAQGAQINRPSRRTIRCPVRFRQRLPGTAGARHSR